MGNNNGKDMLSSSIPPGLSEEDFSTKYQIEKKRIGTGAFSEIKQCTRKSDNQTFALKLVKKKGLDPIDINALKKEVTVLKKCNNHTNLIKLIDYCDTKNRFFMVLELCKGKNMLDVLVEMEHMTEVLAKHVTISVINGLKYLHDNGFVHRDLKPDNLMFYEEGKEYEKNIVKIIDLGLSGEFTENSLCKTPCGTAHYAAPEVLEGAEHNSQADLWSLGGILYTMLSGRPPFYDEHNNMKNIHYLVKSGKYNFSGNVWENVSDEAKDLIRCLLVKDVNKRLSCYGVLQHPWIKGITLKEQKKIDFDKKMKYLPAFDESKSQFNRSQDGFIPPPPGSSDNLVSSKTMPRIQLNNNLYQNNIFAKSAGELLPSKLDKSQSIQRHSGTHSASNLNFIPPPPSNSNIPPPPITPEVKPHTSFVNNIPPPPKASDDKKQNASEKNDDDSGFIEELSKEILQNEDNKKLIKNTLHKN